MFHDIFKVVFLISKNKLKFNERMSVCGCSEHTPSEKEFGTLVASLFSIDFASAHRISTSCTEFYSVKSVNCGNQRL